MLPALSRERHTLANGKNLDRLLVDGQVAAVVGAIREQAADLLTSYYGHQWKWWALVSGVAGGTWLVRNTDRTSDSPLVLDPKDKPVIVKSSWDSPATPAPPPKVRSGRRPKA